MSNLSEYEKKRLENIRENEALLRNLEIPNLKPTRPSPSSTNNLRKHTPKKTAKKPVLPTRISARIRGKSPENDFKQELDSSIGAALSAKRPQTIDTLDANDHKRLKGLFETALKPMPNTEPVKVKQETESISDQELRDRLKNLKIQHNWTTVKVTPNRISGCLFHPSATKLLACAVDTEGYLGFWDIEQVQEDEEPVVFQYKPHTRTITDMHFNPIDNSKLMTSSYDGLIRTYDMNKAEFDILDMGLDKYPITGFDVTKDGHSIWFCTSNGEVGFVDLRSGGEPTTYMPREKKIGCIHINPVYQDLIAVSSNDRTATIWDLRMLKKSTPLQSIEHGYSVTSSYWSPKGDILATTSYDDYIRLFDLSKDAKSLELKSAIKHNNHTGRWVTNFRARWNRNKVNGTEYQHMAIGNMNQTVDIYSGETGQEITSLYDRDHITAIPSVAQFHPNTQDPVILTGNASGRMVCWS